MKRAIALGFALLMTAGALAGCNTMEGAGQDVEGGGQHVQDAAQETPAVRLGSMRATWQSLRVLPESIDPSPSLLVRYSHG